MAVLELPLLVPLAVAPKQLHLRVILVLGGFLAWVVDVQTHGVAHASARGYDGLALKTPFLIAATVAVLSLDQSPWIAVAHDAQTLTRRRVDNLGGLDKI